VILYAAFMPFITILQAVTDMVLFCWELLHPLYAVACALAWCGGWTFLTYFWGRCYSVGHEVAACPEWTTFRGGVSLARLPFAALLAVLYLVYVGLAAPAVYRATTEAVHRRDSTGFHEFGSNVELDRL
jgi:hypothetical protein